jgi:hypothetical protein
VIVGLLQNPIGDLGFEILTGLLNADKGCAYSCLDDFAIGNFEFCVSAGRESGLLLRRPIGT